MLNEKRFGLAGAILWGFCMFIMTIFSMYTGYATIFLTMMADIYPGYSISWVGSFVGLVYGFIDAGIGLYVLAWIYNKLT